jgi:hypothetical protein
MLFALLEYPGHPVDGLLAGKFSTKTTRKTLLFVTQRAHHTITDELYTESQNGGL